MGNLPPSNETNIEKIRGISNEQFNKDIKECRKKYNVYKEHSSFIIGFIIGIVIGSIVTITLIY